MSKKTVISAANNAILRLKVLAKKKENVRSKLVTTAGELAATAEKKEDIRERLAATAKQLATVAKEKEDIRNKLVVTAKQLAVTAKEKEAVRRKLEVTAEELKRFYETLEKKVIERTKDLVEAKAKNEAMLASIGDGLVMVDKEGKIIYINNSFEEMLGWKMQEVIGKSMTEAVPREDQNGTDILFKERILTKVLSGKKFIADLANPIYLIRKDKSKFPVSIIVAPVVIDGKIIGAVETFRDITERKKMEEELIKDKEMVEKRVVERTAQLEKESIKLHTSIESLRDGFIITNEKGEIIVINGIAKRILCDVSHNPKPGIIRGAKNIYSCTTEQIQTNMRGVFDIKSYIEKSLKEEKVFQLPPVEFRGLFLSFYLSPIVSVSDKVEVIGAVISIRDITKEKALERTRNEFFSIASHELRTPLTAIRGNTSMILDYFGDQLTNPQMKEMIDDIHESSVRLISIVNDFLDVSRLEQKKLEFKKESVDLDELIKEVMKEFEPSVLQRKIDLRMEEIADKLPAILADRNRVKEVLINLISNSFKSIEKEGEIVVKVENVGNGLLKVLVSDTGRGIALVQQNLLFRKFQQAGESLLTRDSAKGTGLGLYISRMMIEGMGGTIQLESSVVDKGTTFSFTLPIAK